MAFRVEVSRRARNDLIEISWYIQASNSAQAKEWFSGLEAKAASLHVLPERGASLPSHPQYRQLVYGSLPHVYRILYRIDLKKQVVVIVHVRHGARAGDGLL